MAAGAALALLAVLAGGADAGDLLGLRQFGANDGLPQMTVLAIAEDGDGYLYIGSQDGLARYDGRGFEALPLRPGLRDVVSELRADDRGRLWIGSSENGLFLRERDGGIRPITLPGAGSAIEALERGREPGLMWVGTPEGLYRCRELDCQRIAGSEGVPVSVLLEGRGPAGPCLWVGSNDRGVLRFDHAGDDLVLASEVLDQADGLPNRVVRSLAHFGSQPGADWPPLWIGTGRGVARINSAGATRHDSSNGFPVGAAMAMAVARGSDGAERLHVATYGGGLVTFDGSGQQRIQATNEGLPERFLYSLLARDRGPGQASQLWIGTSSAGLLRVEPGRWLTLDERHVLPARTVVSVGRYAEADGRARIWAGTLSGAVVQGDDGDWRYLLPRDWWTSVVYSVVVDPRGRLWAGTLAGLVRLDGEQAREFTAETDPLPGVSVHQLLWRGGVDGELWVGTGHGLARWREDGGFEPLFAGEAALADAGIRGLVALPGGSDVAVATSQGLFFTDGSRLQPLPAGCLPHREVIDLAVTGDGTVWVATREGAVRVRRDAASVRCDRLRLPGDGPRAVYALVLDRQGRLYLFGYDGARRVDNPDGAADGTEVPRWLHYGLADGLPSLEFNRDAVLDDAGRVWAANNAGLVMLDTRSTAAAPPLAPLRLEARQGVEALAAGAHLPADHAALAFRYRLLAFDAEHRLRYRSRLVGLEATSTDWSEQGERRFDRLPAGDYRFELEARDAWGRTVKATPLAFSVAHPAWRHPLALAAATLALLAAGAGWGRWRARQLAQRAAQLEREVASRTAALAQANAALSQASLTDPLTGCHNRRQFHAGFEAWRPRTPWLLLVDIDHFKTINDQHGHDAGDAVLVEVAARLRAAVAGDGEVVRWGGEEFLVLLPGSDEASVRARLQFLLDAVAVPAMATAAGALSVHASIGAARLRPGEDVDAAVKRADQALYEAKRQGRARAILAPAPA